MTGIVGGLAHVVRKGRELAVHPIEAGPYVLERVSEWREGRLPAWRYEVSGASDEVLHDLVGRRWPCGERDQAFEAVWSDILDTLGERGLRVGRLAFGHWDDGDVRLGQVLWCLARHLRPESVVETGVGRGITSRVLLEALELNRTGHLSSIDLAPFSDGLARQTGAAVPDGLFSRWTLAFGSSRRRLPGVVARLGRIGLFVHDSSHTARNVQFELAHVWPALAPGGVVVIDDVEKNDATGRFLRDHPEVPAVIMPASDGQVLIGCLVKPSLPGVTYHRRSG